MYIHMYIHIYIYMIYVCAAVYMYIYMYMYMYIYIYIYIIYMYVQQQHHQADEATSQEPSRDCTPQESSENVTSMPAQTRSRKSEILADARKRMGVKSPRKKLRQGMCVCVCVSVERPRHKIMRVECVLFIVFVYKNRVATRPADSGYIYIHAFVYTHVYEYVHTHAYACMHALWK